MSKTAEDLLYITRNQTKLFQNMFPELKDKLNTLKLDKEKTLATTKKQTDPVVEILTDGYIDLQFERLGTMQKIVEKINLNFTSKTLKQSKPNFTLDQHILIKKALMSSDMLSILAKLMTYGYYILRNILGQGCEQLFKDNLKLLQKFCDENSIDFLGLVNAFSDLTSLLPEFEILGILPLACQSMSELDQKMKSYINAEIMGHGVAYQVAEKTGQYKKLVIKEDSGKELESYTIQEINVETSVDQKNMRLMGTILIPENIATSQEPTLYITWAGTYSLATLRADFEVSAGEESYRKAEKQILQQIAEALQAISNKTDKPIKIFFSGHSLGAALALLTFHSIQRLLALTNKNERLGRITQKLENVFKNDLEIKSNYCLPEKFFETLNFLKKLEIKEMVIETFNATRVLGCVAEYSNVLCKSLIEHNIAQTANIGLIKNDSIENTGERYILDDIATNGAKFTILQVNTKAPTIASMLETAALLVEERNIARFFVNNSDLNQKNENNEENRTKQTDTVLFASGLIYFCEQLSLKINAHTINVFSKDKADPDFAYFMYCNKDQSGKLDPIGVIQILEMITSSSYFVKIGTDLISDLIGELSPEEKICKLLLHLDSRNIPQELSEIINTKSVINQKTFLHIAIEKGYLKLARELVKINEINVNLKDKDNTSPMLAIMNYLNTYWSKPPSEAYALACEILEKTNYTNLTQEDKIEKKSVQKISIAWNNQYSILKSNETIELCSKINFKLSPIHAISTPSPSYTPGYSSNLTSSTDSVNPTVHNRDLTPLPKSSNF